MRCSSGTYIRAIARDLGAALGVGGHLTALRRTARRPFGLDRGPHARRAGGRARGAADRRCRPGAFPRVDLDDEQAADVRVGRPLEVDLGRDGPVALFAPDGEFLALYEPTDQPGLARATAVFTG